MTAPVRTCIGCRRRAPWGELVRVVAVPGPDGAVLARDEAHRLPGRGAWLHDDAQCLELARRKNAFRRALRVSGALADDFGSW